MKKTDYVFICPDCKKEGVIQCLDLELGSTAVCDECEYTTFNPDITKRVFILESETIFKRQEIK